MQDFSFQNSKIENHDPEKHPHDTEQAFSGTLPDSLSWEASDQNISSLTSKRRLTIILAFTAIVGYALYTESPVMAITFILAGIVWFMISEREAQTIRCSVSERGIIVGNSLYEYENIKSFCIFQEEGLPFVSFRIQADMFPHLHIPIGDQDPKMLRAILLQYIPEKNHHPRIVDILDRFF